jgi:DDE superfamily endonuclease
VEKGGGAAALAAAGVTATTTLAWADEMRLGLHGRVRRVWAPVGVKVRQRVQLRYEWRYLSLAVDARDGRLWWQWHATMRKEAIAPVVAAWQAAGIAALVWDGAPAHRARLVRAVGTTLLTQPAAAPELNPAERVFQELRRAVEGLIYATLEEKVVAVERELTALAADSARLRRLVGWDWIAESLAQLPTEYPAPS